MLSLDQALAHYAEITPLSGLESLALEHAHGRILARDLRSSVALPPMRQSAMDGYALNTHDLVARNSLPQQQSIAAGDAAQPLLPGHCARIFTGAPVPHGANAVEIQENVLRVDPANDNNGEINFQHRVQISQNIREQGEEIASGQIVLPAGQRLDAQSLSIAANAGHPYLACRKRARVSIIVTGNELVAPGHSRNAHQIYESNGQFLRHFVAEQGAVLSGLEHCRDDLQALCEAVQKSLEHCDVLLISGGASVGDHDHSRAAVKASGVTETFWKVAQKPGKPISFGLGRNGQKVFVLPGNPASVYVCAMIHVRAALHALQGRTAPACVSGRSMLAIDADSSRTRLIRAGLSLEQGQLNFVPLPRQASHMSTNLASTLAILRIPAGHNIPRGGLINGWLVFAF